MANGKDVSLKMALEKLLDVYKLKGKFNETSVVNAWPEVMGPAVASRTQKVYIKDKKLFVKVESSVIKNELSLMKTQILGKLNEHVGEVVVEELILL